MFIHKCSRQAYATAPAYRGLNKSFHIQVKVSILLTHMHCNKTFFKFSTRAVALPEHAPISPTSLLVQAVYKNLARFIHCTEVASTTCNLPANNMIHKAQPRWCHVPTNKIRTREVNKRFVQKVSGLTTVHEVDKAYGVLTLIVFNTVPFSSYTLRPTFLPLLETFCELLFRDV